MEKILFGPKHTLFWGKGPTDLKFFAYPGIFVIPVPSVAGL